VTPEMIDRYWELNRGPGIRNANRIRFTMPDSYFFGEDKFFRANMGKIAVPTLILWGRDDELIPVSTADIFKNGIPGAQVIIYDQTGHIPMEEVADRSAADVRTFMRGGAPPS
jgi:pimeloyl-ACP methyl ester carboxylesterase